MFNNDLDNILDNPVFGPPDLLPVSTKRGTFLSAELFVGAVIAVGYGVYKYATERAITIISAHTGERITKSDFKNGKAQVKEFKKAEKMELKEKKLLQISEKTGEL